MAATTVTIFTDPGCPFGFNAQRQDLQLRWIYGDDVDVRVRMIVLKEQPVSFDEIPLTPEMLVANGERMRDAYGMPMAVPTPKDMPATLPACKAVVGARQEHGETTSELLLRTIRIRVHSAAEPIEEPTTLRAAAVDAGIDPDAIERWIADDGAVEAALREEMAAARRPAPEALALPHKLARDGEHGWRYTASSTIVESGERRAAAPGFQPWAAYEVAFATAAPELSRRAPPQSAGELLRWAPHALATAEVAAVVDCEISEAREQLQAAGARFEPYANDGYWSLG